MKRAPKNAVLSRKETQYKDSTFLRMSQEKEITSSCGKTTFIEIAQHFHGLGFNVSAISEDLGSSTKKAPYFKWQQLANNRQTIEKVNSYKWHKCTGIGAFAGINDIRCIDFDKCNNIDFIHSFLQLIGLPVKYQWLVKSGSNNGYHIWLRCKEYPTKDQKKNQTRVAKDSSLFQHLEYRWNHHIVLPPSLHESGNTYQFINVDLPVQEPAYVDIANIKKAVDTYCRSDQPKKESAKNQTSTENSQDDSIDEYTLFEFAVEFTKNHKNFSNGDRNNSVYQLARNCNRYDIPMKLALSEILSKFEEPDFTEKEITQTVISAYNNTSDKGKYREYVINKIKKKREETSVGSLCYDYTKKTADKTYEWPEPEEIAAPMLPVKKITLDMLPDSFAGYNADIAKRTNCPLDFTAVTSIVMAAALIGTSCGIRPKEKDDWLVIPNLWGGVVAPPSSLKTPSMSEVLKMLDRLISKAKQDYEQAMKEHLKATIDCEAVTKAYKWQQEQKAKGKRTVGEELTLQDKLKEPTEKRYQTNDTTIEKLGELLNENPRGILVFRDELTGLFASWERLGHEQDKAFYLEAFNGTGSQQVDRIGRKSMYVNNVCISLLGGIQPAKLAGYLHNSMGYGNDGFVQRLQLFVYPDKKDYNYVDEYPDTKAKDRMWNIIQKLDELNYSEIAFKDEYDKFPYLRFSKEAQEVFIKWYTKLKLEKIDNPDEHTIIVEHLAKYSSLMPSLALIFHLIDYAEGKTESKHVSVDAAQMAVKWCDYLEPHARRIYQMVTHPSSQSAKELSKKILAEKLKDGFTARDIYRKEWYLLNTPEIVKSALDYLIDANWLNVESQQKNGGRPAADKYFINPKIFKKV